MRKLLGLIALLCSVSAPAHAEDTAASVLADLKGSDRDTRSYASLMLFGIYRGIDASSYMHSRLGEHAFTCIPEKLSVTTDQLTDILARYVEAHPKAAEWSAAYTLVFALNDVFPCQTASQTPSDK